MKLTLHILILFVVLGSSELIAQDLTVCAGVENVEFSASLENNNNACSWWLEYPDGSSTMIAQNTDNISLDFDSTGNYVLRFYETVSGGCEGVVSSTILVNPMSQPSFTVENNCVGDTTLFINTSVASSNFNFIWSIQGMIVNETNASHIFNKSGIYNIELSLYSNTGCYSSVEVPVEIHTLPDVEFYSTPEQITIADPTATFVNLSSNGLANWDFGDGYYAEDWEPTHEFDRPGEHKVHLSIENEFGCIDSTNRTFLIENEMYFFVPEAFTPNNDDVNDLLVIEGFRLDFLQSYELMILNNWGNVVFTTNDINHHWDGKESSGSPAMIDTYTWSIRTVDELGKLRHHLGTLDLIR